MALNEFEIIERLFNHLTGPDESVLCGIGDDGAVLGVPAGVDLVVSTDTLVSGVHFFPESEPADIGYKTLAVNLSDMAAMAAQPRWATLSLTLPETDMDWLGAFSRGFAGIARDHRFDWRRYHTRPAFGKLHHPGYGSEQRCCQKERGAAGRWCVRQRRTGSCGTGIATAGTRGP